MKYDTSFAESELMLAAIAQDEEEMARLLTTMLDGELRALDRACGDIYEAIVAERARRQSSSVSEE